MLMDTGDELAIDLLLSLGTDEHTAWFYERLRKHETRPDVSGQKGRTLKDYHRFEVPDIKLGLRKKYVLQEIEETTEKWLESQVDKIREYAEMLVQHRRARAATTRWDQFALGVKYYCYHPACQARNLCLESRGKFYDHIEAKHGFRKDSSGNVDIEAQLDQGRRFGCADTAV